MPTHVVEVATFKLKPGVSDGQLLALEARIRTGRITQMAGYISRELARDEERNEWLMLMRFQERHQMDAWIAGLKDVEDLREMAALLDRASMTMRFFTHREPEPASTR